MEQGSVLGTFFPFIIFGLIFYFLLIRPQQKQAKAHALMLAGLQKGDKIVTSGGLKCTVIKPDDDFIKVYPAIARQTHSTKHVFSRI